MAAEPFYRGKGQQLGEMRSPPPPLPPISPPAASAVGRKAMLVENAAAFDPYYVWLGIPPADRPLNHYRLLGIADFENNAEVISNAADKQMAHVRSFQIGEHAEVCQKLLNELARARVCLLDPTKKAAYDRALQQAQSAIPPPVPRLSTSQVRQEAELARRRRADRDREPKPTGLPPVQESASLSGVQSGKERESEAAVREALAFGSAGCLVLVVLCIVGTVVEIAQVRSTLLDRCAAVSLLLAGFGIIRAASTLRAHPEVFRQLGKWVRSLFRGKQEEDRKSDFPIAESLDRRDRGDQGGVFPPLPSPVPESGGKRVPRPASILSSAAETKVAASNEKLATASLVCGIVALAYPSFITGPIGSVAAIVTGILGLRSEKRGRAIAGMVLAGLALAVFGTLKYLEVSIRRDLNDLLRDEQQADDEQWKSPVVSPTQPPPVSHTPEQPVRPEPPPPAVGVRSPAADGVRRILRRASAHADAGDYDSAIADCTEAIRLDPKRSEAYYFRGQSYYFKDDCNSAIADFTEAIRLDPKNTSAYSGRGSAYQEKGDYDRAIADCTEAIRLDPKNADAYFERGGAYHGKGDYDRAIADYTQAIRLDPTDTFAYVNRGLSYRLKHDYDSAIADFTEAIRLYPKNAIAYFCRGMAYDSKHDYDSAIADYTEAIRLYPTGAASSLYVSRGRAYGAKRDYDSAITDYTEAIRLDPTDASAYYGRGVAYQGKGQRTAAERDLAKARELGYKP